MWGLRPPPRFDSSELTHLADAGLIRVSPGGWERNIFLPNSYPSIRWLLGLPGPDPGHFLLVQKVTKNTFKGGGCSDSPSPLKNPSTHNGFSRGLRPLAKEATPLAPGEFPAANRTLGGPVGDSKGGLAPPFVSLRGGGS